MGGLLSGFMMIGGRGDFCEVRFTHQQCESAVAALAVKSEASDQKYIRVIDSAWLDHLDYVSGRGAFSHPEEAAVSRVIEAAEKPLLSCCEPLASILGLDSAERALGLNDFLAKADLRPVPVSVFMFWWGLLLWRFSFPKTGVVKVGS